MTCKKTIYLINIVILFLIFSPMTISNSVSTMPLDNSDIYLDIMYKKIAPPSEQMNYYINKYAIAYKIPLNLAYKIAKLETGYKGPLHYSYKHDLTSIAYAEGPMQILLSTAREVANDNTITREELRNNIDLNVHISMKFLNQLYKRYHSWDIVAGYYNTGYPIINEYAISAVK